MKTGELCRRRDTAGRVVLSRLTSLITNKMLTFIMEEMNLSLSLSLSLSPRVEQIQIFFLEAFPWKIL